MGLLNRRGLRFRIGLLAVLGLSVAFAAFAVLGLRAVDKRSKQIENERLAMAQSIAAQIDRSLGHALSMLAAAGTREGVDLYDGDLEPELHALEHAYLLAELPTYRVLLADRDGRVLLTAPDDPGLIGLDLSDQVYIRDTLRSGRPRVSDALPATVLGQPVIALSVPARDAQGNAAGLFVQAVDLLQPRFSDFLRYAQPGETGYAQLVDGEGTIIASIRPQRLLREWEHRAVASSLLAAQQPQVAVYPAVDSSKEADVLAFAPLSVAGWGVTVEQDAGEALAPSRRLRWEFLFLGLAALLIALFMVWLTTGQVVQPVRELTAAARRIAGGELDRTMPGIRGMPDEISELARAFEQMRASLATSRADMERHASELEALRHVALDITAQLELSGLLKGIVRWATELLDADGGSFYLYNPERGDLELVVSDRLSDYIGTRLKIGEGLSGRVVATGRPLIVDNYGTWEGRASVYKGELATALIGVPVRWQERVLGVINVGNSAVHRTFDDNDLHLLEAFARQAAIAVQNARLFEAAEQRAAELEALRQVNLNLTSSLELEAVLNAILEGAFKLLAGIQNAHIFLHQENRLTFAAARWADGRMSQPVAAPRPHGLTYTVARQGEPIVLSDMRTDPLFADAPPTWTGAIIGLPLKIGQRVVGVMNVAFPEPRDIPEAELRVLRLLAGQAAIAIENARLHRAKRRQAEESTALLDIAQAVSSTLSLTQLLKQVAIRTAHTCRANRCSILLVDPAGEQLEPIMSQFADGHDDLKLWNLWRTTTADRVDAVPLFRQVIRQRQPVVVEDVTQIDVLPRKWTEPFGVKKVLAVPLISHDRAIGAMMLDYKEPARRFNQEQVDLAMTIASQVAVSIENAGLFQAERVARRRAETLQEVAAALGSTLNLAELLDLVLEELQVVVSYDSASVQLLRNDHMEIIAGRGFSDPDQVIGQTFSVWGDPDRIVIAQRQPVLVPDAQIAFPRFKHGPHSRIRSWLGVPLMYKSQVIGMITLDRTEVKAFSQADAEIALAFANHVAVALENARLYEATRRQAITDGLTGLYNSRYFYQALEKELERSRRYNHPCSLLMLDLDDFKKYNDRYGHLAGDDLLRELASLIRSVIRQTDTPVRYGGEEFAVILPETDNIQIGDLAERLGETVREHKFVVRDTQRVGRITVSQGVATYPLDAGDVEGLVEAADMALLRAKAKKDQICEAAEVLPA